MPPRPRKRVTRRATARRNVVKEIKVGVLGQAPKIVLVETVMTAEQLATSQGIGNFSRVKASKTTLNALKEINKDDEINGYKIILYTPEVSGGK